MTQIDDTSGVRFFERGLVRKIGVGLAAVTIGWIVGGALHLLTSSSLYPDRVELSPLLLEEIADSLPPSRFYLVFDVGSCGTPFYTTVNYLHNRRLNGLVVVTSDASLRKLRGVGREGRIEVVGGHDELVRRITERADAVLLERGIDGRLTAYPFVRPNRSEFVAVLDDVLGVSTQRKAPTTDDKRGRRPDSVL